MYLDKHVLQVDEPALDDGLQEDTDQPHHPVFVDFGFIGTAALLHAVFEEDVDELLGELDVAAEAVEDLEGVRAQLHLREGVVVLGDLRRVGHAHQQLESDVRVVYHDVRQSLRGHADVEHQLWVDLKGADQDLLLVIFQTHFDCTS